jgi:hypothetical protein
MLAEASIRTDASRNIRLAQPFLELRAASFGATMKTKISPLLLVTLLAASASAADKYVSADFGFAAAYPANVVRTQPSSDTANFVAGAPGGAWVTQVKVTRNVAMPREVTHEFMAAKLAEVLKDGGMTQTGATSFTTFQGHPALIATATFFVNNVNTRGVYYTAVADMKLIFVQSRNLAKGQNRIYWVAAWALEGQDRSRIQPFLDSFELK